MVGTWINVAPDMVRVIILLASPRSRLQYLDIDTSHFSGNEAPASSVFALPDSALTGKTQLSPNDARWKQILPVVNLEPNNRHIFELGPPVRQEVCSALMVRMIPDGGMVSQTSNLPLAETL